MDARLIVVGGKASKGSLRLKLPTVVGRSRNATVTIAHPMVSRRHCELFERDGFLVVRDLGSTNGTLLGGRRVQEAALPPDAEISIGPLTFRVQYQYDGDLEALPAPLFVATSSTEEAESPEFLAFEGVSASASAPAESAPSSAEGEEPFFQELGIESAAGPEADFTSWLEDPPESSAGLAEDSPASDVAAFEEDLGFTSETPENVPEPSSVAPTNSSALTAQTPAPREVERPSEVASAVDDAESIDHFEEVDVEEFAEETPEADLAEELPELAALEESPLPLEEEPAPVDFVAFSEEPAVESALLSESVEDRTESGDALVPIEEEIEEIEEFAVAEPAAAESNGDSHEALDLAEATTASDHLAAESPLEELEENESAEASEELSEEAEPFEPLTASSAEPVEDLAEFGEVADLEELEAPFAADPEQPEANDTEAVWGTGEVEVEEDGMAEAPDFQEASDEATASESVESPRSLARPATARKKKLPWFVSLFQKKEKTSDTTVSGVAASPQKQESEASVPVSEAAEAQAPFEGEVEELPAEEATSSLESPHAARDATDDEAEDESYSDAFDDFLKDLK